MSVSKLIGAACACLLFCAAAPAGEQNGGTGELSLEQVVGRFLRVDPDLPVAQLEREVAQLRVALSRDRWRLDGEGFIPFGYNLYVLPNQALHVGSGELIEAGVRSQDPVGGALRVSANGRVLSEPALSDGGHRAGLQASYTLPLWRNLGGELYALETTRLSRVEEARAAEVEARRLDRCVSAIELYLSAYVLQEHAAVWEELLAHKERTYKRTARDYGRKMVQRLDFLTAKSDWLAARQRHAAFEGRRRQAFAVLDTYLSAAEVSLASPEPFFVSAGDPPAEGDKSAFEKHPVVLVLDQEVEALRAETRLSRRRYLPEISLVPTLGAQYLSHMLVAQPGGSAYVPLGNAFASLGLLFELPLIEPNRDFERALLGRRQQQLLSQRSEAVRFLDERARGAREAIGAVDARLELTEEKVENIRKQIAEAGAMYGSGRLEFQDYLQHWAFLEEARFERLNLLYSRWRAQTALLRATGPVPDLCQQEG